MVQVPWPITHAPGALPQEGAGKLQNCFAERRGDEQGIVWVRAPGCTVFTREPSAGSATGSATALAVSSVVDTQGMAQGDAQGVAVGESI